MGIDLKMGIFMQPRHLLAGFFERVSISLIVLAPWLVSVNDQDFVISQRSPVQHLHHTQLYVPFAALIPHTSARNFRSPPKKYSRVYSLSCVLMDLRVLISLAISASPDARFSYDSPVFKIAMVWFPATEVAVGVSTTVKVKFITCKLLLTLVPSPESLTRKGVSVGRMV